MYTSRRIKLFDTVINLLIKKLLNPDSFTGESYHTFKEQINHNLSQTTDRKKRRLRDK